MHGSAIVAISQPFLYVEVQLNNTLHLTALMVWQNLISRVSERAEARLGETGWLPLPLEITCKPHPTEGPRCLEAPHIPSFRIAPCGRHSLEHTHTSSPSPPANFRARPLRLIRVGFFHFFSFSCLEFLCSSEDLGDFILLNTSAISQTEVLKILFAMSHLVTESVLK